MSMDEFHNWIHAYFGAPYMPFNNHPEFRELISWFETHYRFCEYFNGFSISKPPRDRRDEDVIVRCSCGSTLPIPSDLWRVRLQNMDLEDIIENLNYECRDRANFSMKERCEHYINVEIKKRKFMEEYDAQWTRKAIKDKNGSNAVFDLEVDEEP